jgi:predicted AlkP superfamily pyrophosphatase or phosphodiesterase
MARLGLVTIALLAGADALGAGRPAPQPSQDAPRLVVLLVVDQFRGDYVETYGHHWTRGLRRLLDQGAYFPRAAYSFATTKTCAGHATIGSGSLPRTHGMIDNAWFDRQAGRAVACTDDQTVKPVVFGGGEGHEHHSGTRLAVRNLADEMQAQSRPAARVVSLSLKARSAIGLGGHGGTGTVVVWQEGTGSFATSSAYTRNAWPEVERYVDAHPIANARRDVWTRSMPESAYLYDDAGEGETTDNVFPHPLARPADRDDRPFTTRWARSPWSDAYLGDMAATLAGRYQLGRRGATDLLAVSFSALDLVGHAWGPRSHEVQDTLARLDGTIDTLLRALDELVGEGRYVVALTSDHGVPIIPQQAQALGLDAGRVSTTTIRNAAGAALSKLIGGERLVVNVSSPFVYFADGVLDRIDRTPGAREAVSQAILGVPGVARVFWADDIARSDATTDPHLQALRRGYFAGRSGDVAFIVKPNWVPQSSGTTHGSPNDYDTRVPIILAGAGIARGEHLDAARPEDIAPTLAALVGISLPRADGRVLTSALVRRP